MSLFWNQGKEEARPVCRHPSTCPICTSSRGGRAWRPSKPHEVGVEGVDGEEKNEDDDNEEEVKGRRRYEEDMQDSLVVEEGMIVKFPLVRVATFAVPASRFSPARRR